MLYKFKLHEFGHCDRSMPHMGMIICSILIIHCGQTCGSTSMLPYRYAQLQPGATIHTVLRGIGPVRPAG